MEKKRTITFYKDLNEPYERMLERGLRETPKERYRGFFAMQFRLWAIKGYPHASKRTITVSKPPWI
ncbi:hypothetical protein [Spirosoma arcticum]